MSAFPPHQSQISRPVTAQYALSVLQDYLVNSASQPYLLPNATLQAGGPSAQDASSNITVHNLKRVEAGLRGEWLAPSLELDGVAEDTFNQASFIAPGIEEAHDEQPLKEEWQDLDEYKREQSSIDGDIGSRERSIAREGEDAIIPVDRDAAAKILDKAARKDAKRRRKDDEKKQRHESKK